MATKTQYTTLPASAPTWTRTAPAANTPRTATSETAFPSTRLASASPADAPKTTLAGSADNAKLRETQAQVEQVIGIMKHNVELVLIRDEKLTTLEGKSEDLLQSASKFERAATKLKRTFQWKNIKSALIMAGVVILVIGVVALVVVLHV